jgi:hypothetical protein
MSELVCSLDSKDLNSFWLPCTQFLTGPSCCIIESKANSILCLNFLDAAYHFTSAATMLLRCALETSNSESRAECIKAVTELVYHLRRLKDDSNWDLGDTCLRQCEDVVKHIIDGSSSSRNGTNQRPKLSTIAPLIAPSRVSARVPVEPDVESGNYQEGTSAHIYRSNFSPGLNNLENTNILSLESDNQDQSQWWDDVSHLLLPDLWQIPGIDEDGAFFM